MFSHFSCCLHAQAAAQRKPDFELGVFADPIYFGQFPDSVRARLPHLPEISPELVCLSGIRHQTWHLTIPLSLLGSKFFAI